MSEVIIDKKGSTKEPKLLYDKGDQSPGVVSIKGSYSVFVF